MGMRRDEHRDLARFLNGTIGELESAAVAPFIDFIAKHPRNTVSRFRSLFHALGRPHGGSGWEGCVGSYYFLLWALFAGCIDVIAVDVGATAGKDAEREANQAALDSLAEFGLSAVVDMEQKGGRGEPDGTLAFSRSLPARRFNNPADLDALDRLPQSLQAEYLLAPPRDGILLEIGDCLPSRTYTRLCQYEAVARWPYGGNQPLFVLLVNEHGRDGGAFPIRDLPELQDEMKDQRRANLKVSQLLIGAYIQLTTYGDPDFADTEYRHTRELKKAAVPIEELPEGEGVGLLTARKLFDLDGKGRSSKH
ncbi:hypothetical protein [Actinomadura hibisca]|uniref:hypothetical protein n=1 Tax=Actinomadura hibisca TaxID=68565 RepID=UPI00082E10AB|nr:hypothetical protein [Actinomadura hibisca]